VRGAIHNTRAVWPLFTAHRCGRIVKVTSVVGYIGTRGRLPYGTAKGAVHGFTRSLSKESGEYGIHVNAVSPGALTRPVKASTNNFPDEGRRRLLTRTGRPHRRTARTSRHRRQRRSLHRNGWHDSTGRSRRIGRIQRRRASRRLLGGVATASAEAAGDECGGDHRGRGEGVPLVPLNRGIDRDNMLTG